jgi:hypothetical protein
VTGSGDDTKNGKEKEEISEPVTQKMN